MASQRLLNEFHFRLGIPNNVGKLGVVNVRSDLLHLRTNVSRRSETGNLPMS